MTCRATQDRAPKVEPDDLLAVMLLKSFVGDLSDHHRDLRLLFQLSHQKFEAGRSAPPIIVISLQELKVDEAGIVKLIQAAMHGL